MGIIMSDIDGTLISKPDDGKVDFKNIIVEPIEHVVQTLRLFGRYNVLHFFTKRHEEYRYHTDKIIKDIFGKYFQYNLYMRDDEIDINQPTHLIKYEMFTILQLDTPSLYIEDDISVINYFNSQNIPTVHHSIFEGF